MERFPEDGEEPGPARRIRGVAAHRRDTRTSPPIHPIPSISFARSRISTLRTLPVTVIGNSSTTRT